MRARNILCSALVSGLATVGLALPAAAIDTSARAALVLDVNTGTVLLSKNADVPLPPASMSKLMTLYMLFEALETTDLTLDSEFRVSEKAWRMGGSKMFLEVGKTVRVEDLIMGVIVHSGNDACVVIAENLAGSEAAFADRMTKKGRDLGLKASTFANSTGWPHPDQRMSAQDLVLLANLLVRDFPDLYPYFAETSFTWNGITQENRNPLLYLNLGADGLKTGHTEEAGYGLVASAERDDRRVTLMISGLDSSSDRRNESERLLNWAFRDFSERALFEADETIAVADLWIGTEGQVELVADGPVRVMVPYGVDEVTAEVRYRGPIEAPVEAGQQLATLEIGIEGQDPVRVPLLARDTVERGGFTARLAAAAATLRDRVFPPVATQ
ncbi:D-alanyl-D-alanine carboxypeptidase family protein [Oceanomicrobium pacificus]|uniref:serine-type D-Ala-D-Ala carboxypeptidase n=1 Tax=Oceanomicrobium pacificus TaxID=2692916 RepID=A0A6B0TSF6_9RHOB|nr:D-alanyl-D-alanine carboxypeptidase family protein [Oceanomicrobium pacificus]MXU65669.1 D-alanyl-D-alanine carboxypeptidase [Oceanomicrobium pacificus]